MDLEKENRDLERKNAGLRAENQIDRLANWLMKSCPEEFGNHGKAPLGESAVEMAIRLLETAEEQHLL